MSRFSPNFGLQVVEPGDNPYINDYKFFAANIDTIDTAMWLALTGHVHDGAVGSESSPVTAPELELDTVGGTIAAGARIWYAYTLVNQNTGLETAASPSAFIDTPDPVSSPNRPTLAWGSLSGVLLPGQYFYILSAYTDVNTNESKAENAVGIIVSQGTSTNRIIITFPDLPDGADGFNIYRRKPGQSRYLYLASVDIGATPQTEYIDNGSVEEDCDRVAPSRNTTNSTNAITISIPGATPSVPEGYYWKIYRTVTQNNWGSSLLQTVVEETFENSGIITPEFVDEGFATSTGAPPSGTIDYSSPGKVNLTDAAHVMGYLPMGLLSGHLAIVSFEYPGTVSTISGDMQWALPFSTGGATPTDQARIVAVQCNFGVGVNQTGQATIVDVNKNNTTIFTNQSNRPRVEIGEIVGDIETTIDDDLLAGGDVISVDVDQVGTGAENLVVNIVVHIQTGSTSVSETYT